ncbi:MAG: SprB repeat-containing protein, partial [Bacteroidota bacterium]
FEITLEEDSLAVNLVAIDQPNCNTTADGAIRINVQGGFGRYQYFWNNGDQIISGDSIEFQGLPPGDYAVSVVDANDDYLCVGYLDAIELLPRGNISVELDNFSNELACFGDTTGAFFITPNGGNAPYQYAWSNGATTRNIQNLAAGNYTLTITDANSCTWTSDAFFPEIVAPNNPFSITSRSATDSLCVGDDSGVISLQFDGGTFPYQYEWNNGATSASIQNLLPGNYSLTATDQNNCTIHLDTSIAIKVEPLSLTLLSSDLDCFEDNSGFVQAKVICGVPPYRYNWNTGDTTENIINLSEGIYEVTITDANNTEMWDFVTLQSPAPLQIDSTEIGLINCEGYIDLQVSGGVPNSYSYTWRNESGSIISNTNRADRLAVGNYTVTIQDANDCQIIRNDFRIDNNLIIDSILTSSVFNRQSNRGTLLVDSIVGGTGPYSYLWLNSSNEIIGTKAVVSGVLIGTYTVVVTDQNGCEKSAQQILDISDPITEVSAVTSFNLYPNPTSQRSFLDLTFSERKDVHVALLNATG